MGEETSAVRLTHGLSNVVYNTSKNRNMTHSKEVMSSHSLRTLVRDNILLRSLKTTRVPPRLSSIVDVHSLLSFHNTLMPSTIGVFATNCLRAGYSAWFHRSFGKEIDGCLQPKSKERQNGWSEWLSVRSG